MPIYEFFCPDCNTLFSFFSRKVNTAARPLCPRCRKRKLERQVSLFAHTGRATEGGGADDLPVDDARMEKAMESLAAEAEGMNEDDPRQAARLMRRMSDMTGMEFGSGMSEALRRMESGEDPEKIEQDMGDVLEGEEEPFAAPGEESASRGGPRRPRPKRDETLYEM